MDNSSLKQTKVGDEFIGYCIIRKSELKHKQNGDPYLVLELGDRSGRLKAKVWNNAAVFFKKLVRGKIVKVKGNVQLFMDSKELNIEKLRLAREDEVEPSILVPTSKKNIPELKTAFLHHLESIKNPHLQNLLNTLFPDEAALDKFLRTAPGKLWHHNYLYGTLEHLVCLLDLADIMIGHYPRLQPDLLKCGLILHNLGKESEYVYEGFIDFSTEGRLIGHIVTGYQTIREAIRSIEGFPENLSLQLLHLVLSHQGSAEKGSPVIPMTMEAIVLHLLNELDSTTNAVERIISNDRIGESEWTKYNKLLDRFIYAGNKNDQEPVGGESK